MFAPDLSQFPWGRALVEAASRGPEAVVQQARKAKRGMSDEASDAVGVEFAELLQLNIDPPGRAGSLVCAARVFGGPKTLAVVGSALRRDPCAPWKATRGLEILRAHRGPAAMVQLLICSHDATNTTVVEKCRAEWRGYPSALPALLRNALVDAPAVDIDRYVALGLEQAMTATTRYLAEDLIAAVTSPAREAVRHVVWAQYEGRRPVAVFMVDPDGANFIDHEYETVTIDPAARVGVAHPADLSPELQEVWGRFLGDLEISAPFPQFDRHASPPDDRGGFGYHDIGATTHDEELRRFLLARGWKDGTYSSFEFQVRGARLMLDTVPLDNGESRLESITLNWRPAANGRRERHLVRTEATNESRAVLEEFAPDTLFR